MILAGDIGGTKTVLALFEQSGASLRQVRSDIFSSKKYESLEAILSEFLKSEPAPLVEAACFGVAGRVQHGRALLTNLPWSLEEPGLAGFLRARRVKLLNDLEAAAYGMLFVPSPDFAVLHSGTKRDSNGNIAVIAPGTGLGEATLYWDETRFHPIASEGGHADFAPRTDQEIELLKYLRTRFGGHVSYERLLSGDGIWNIYSFLRATSGAEEPAWVRERFANGDRNAVVSRLALSGEYSLCVEALAIFCSVLGAEAANLALRCVATGGVIIGGGIAPKVLPALKKDDFMKGFTEKGRFSEWLKEIPVRVALHPNAALLGAANCAQSIISARIT